MDDAQREAIIKRADECFRLAWRSTVAMLGLVLGSIVILVQPLAKKVNDKFSIDLPFVYVPIDYDSFIFLFPAILIALWIYVYTLRCETINLREKLNGMGQDPVLYPTIETLNGRLPEWLGFILHGLMVPVILVLLEISAHRYMRVTGYDGMWTIAVGIGLSGLVLLILWLESMLRSRVLRMTLRFTMIPVVCLLFGLNSNSVLADTHISESSAVDCTKMSAIPITTNLENTELSRKVLISWDLKGANLQRAKLIETVFCELGQCTNLQGAILNHADLTEAKIEGGNLSRAALCRAKLDGANLSCFGSDKCTDLSGADLTGASLRGAVLSGANLQGAKLLVANLDGANLINANLAGANLENVELGADVSGANFTNTDLRDANLTNAKGLTVDQLEGACWHESIPPQVPASMTLPSKSGDCPQRQ